MAGAIHLPPDTPPPSTSTSPSSAGMLPRATSPSPQRPRSLRPAPRLLGIIPAFPSTVLISLASLTIYSYLYSSLGEIVPSVADDADEERVKIEAIRSLIMAMRLLCLVGVGAACGGAWGAIKDSLPLLRLFSLHTLLSFLLSLLILLSLLPLSLIPASHPISSAFSNLLCDELAQSSLWEGTSLSSQIPSSSEDGGWLWWGGLGWGIESCEERWRGMLFVSCLAAGVGMAAAAHAVWVVWAYYRTVRAAKLYGLVSWHLPTSSTSSSSTHSTAPMRRRPSRRSHHHRNRSSSTSSGAGELPMTQTTPTQHLAGLPTSRNSAPRVLILPSTGGPGGVAAAPGKKDTYPPSVAITPPSPDGVTGYTVYAPVQISLEEALALGARDADFAAASASASSSSGGNTPTPTAHRPSALPAHVGGTVGRSRSDSAATIVPSDVGGTSPSSAGAPLPPYEELTGLKRVV